MEERSMKNAIALVASMLLFSAFANAQEREGPPEIKLLTPAECAMVSKRSENDFYIKGPLTIGNTTYESSIVSRNGVSFGGVDHFEVISRSCFQGKPL
jgi:hypothetical protein